jgi:anti-anti-sigma regulatory factor
MASGHVIYDDGTLRITCSGRPPVVALRGDIDEATWPSLMPALEEAVDGQSEVHFDFAGVAYCDLAGLRAIISLTGTSRDGGTGHDGGAVLRCIVLHQVAPELERVLRILGWDSTPGLALDRSLGA